MKSKGSRLSSGGIDGNPKLDTFELDRDHMVDHPAGAHYILWNGPAFLDVGMPDGGFVRFAVASLTPQWTALLDPQGNSLPVAVRFDGYAVSVCWLPYDGPNARPPAPTGDRLSDTDYAAALQKMSATRHRGLIDAAMGIGGWSRRSR